MSLLKRDLYDCRHDNERLTATLNDVTTRHSEVQDTLNSVQAQLGRKDSLLANLQDERYFVCAEAALDEVLHKNLFELCFLLSGALLVTPFL